MASLTTVPPNRVVALLTPTVFAPLAGAIAIAAAEVVPGTNIDETSITAIFIAGATIAFGKAAQWTKGWQAQERRDAEAALAPADLDDHDDDDLEDELDVSDEEILADIAAFHADDDLDLDLGAHDGEDEDDEHDDEDREVMALMTARED